MKKQTIARRKSSQKLLLDQAIGDASCYSSDYEDEEIYTLKNTLKLTVNGEDLEVPADIVKIDDLSKCDKKKTLQELLQNEKLGFTSPLQSFAQSLKAGQFTKTHVKELEVQEKYNNILKSNYYTNQKHLLELKVEKLQEQHQKNLNYVSQLTKRSAILDIDNLSIDSEESFQSINEIKPENSIGHISDQETVYEQLNDELKSEMGDLDDELLENRKIEAQRVLAIENFKTKKPEPEVIMPQITQIARPQKTSKSTTNTKVKQQQTKETIQQFRKEEKARYENPTKPWPFSLLDGTTVVVGPIAKKITANNSKPREHFLLKTERPSYVTILCLVRDAAARLPNGVGTRADICDLLRESQYVNENIPDEKMSNIVSGALDRLHYEQDPCVKFDQEKKLWLYLHRDRTDDFPGWYEAKELKPAKRKDAGQKNKPNKKIKGNDQGFDSGNILEIESQKSGGNY